MADHPVRASPGDRAAPDWPPSGAVRPLALDRIERRAKGVLRTLRAHRQKAPREPQTALEAAYRHAGMPNPRVMPSELARALREATSPAGALEASFAALALAVAANHRARIEGLLAFLELCFTAPARDTGAMILGERLRAANVLQAGSALAGLEYGSGWAEFAAGVRDFAAALHAPHRHHRGPTLWSRLWRAQVGPRRVVVRLEGGLGNQLFQYAAALGYARRTGLPLRLDLHTYSRADGPRDFLLGRLRIPIQRANSLEILLARRRRHFESRGTHDEFLFSDHGSAWLRGYWEDNTYFSDIVLLLKQRIAPRDPAIADAAQELVRQARKGGGSVVGVHLRRGDRGPGGLAQAPLSTLPPAYYQEAASRFPAGTSFLVFSDSPEDIAWCREHLGLAEGAHISFSDGLDPILDLFALANCDHLILSSGTFSWWAGYLGEREGRRVIVPNPLQALSAAHVISPPSTPPLASWEVVTLPPLQ